ncbi:recombinase family protein [Agromyces sp. H66]|uniref:recombinase family protein n=1 Tax=Agromyces sp. H66 TaxID=2529859 RepID=UPI0010AA94DE|nr:recombinase family protein [Agromyces sp. H66]
MTALTSPSARVAIYARQSEDVREGIDRQIERCEALAAVRGYDVVARYRDNDTSAFKQRGEGTEWARMLAALRRGEAEIVVAVDLDRLLRDPRDLATIIDTGARLLTVDGEIDLTTADGEFRASMLASLARFEVRRKSERQRRANEARAAKGRPTPGRRRYGYEVDGVTPREAEAAVVRRMFQHVAEGGSLRSLALALTAEGVDPAPGRSWSTGRVRYILTNPAYGGSVHRFGEALPSEIVEPIVAPALAEEVRAILADEKRRVTPGPTPRYLASGLVSCGICGGRIFNLAKAYRCKADSSHPTIKRELLDDRLRREVALAFLTTARDLLPGQRSAELAPLLDELRRNDAAAAATAADRDEGLLSPTAARERLVSLRDARLSIEAKLDAARVERSASSALADVAADLLGDADSVPLGDVFGPMADEVAARFADLDIDRQRDTVRGLLSVELYPGRDPRRVRVWHLIATHLNPDAVEDYDAV